MQPRSWRAGSAIVLLGLAACARTEAPPPAAAVAPPPMRAGLAPVAPMPMAPDDAAALFLPDMMAFLVDPAAGVLLAAADSDSQADAPVRSPEAWGAVVDAGMQLVQGSEMLARPLLAMGRQDWQGWVAAMRDSAAAGISAAQQRDSPALAAAGMRLRAACQACHALYAPPQPGATAMLAPR